MTVQQIRQFKFSDWQEEWRRGSTEAISGTYLWKQLVRCRRVKDIIGNMRVEEGVVLDYLDKIRGSKEPYERRQPHLIGYHYVSFIDAGGSDVFWFQKIGRLGWRFFYDGTTGAIQDFVYYQHAFNEFNRLLREKWNVEVIEKEVSNEKSNIHREEIRG